MIRIRATLDTVSDARRPSATLTAYLPQAPVTADSAVPMPPWAREALIEPDIISAAAAHTEPAEEDVGEGEGSAAPEAGSPALGDEDAELNVWASSVVITTERPLPEANVLPFCYEVIQPGRPSTAGTPAIVREPMIRIVAAPGVRVLLVPGRRESDPIVRVDVIRVQDPRAIPPLGESINASLVLTGNGVGMHRNGHALEYMSRYTTMHAARFIHDESERDAEVDALLEMARTPSRVSVMPQRDGILFFDNTAERMLQIRVPARAGTWRHADDRSDVDARFGYSINPHASDDEVAVVVAATAQVEVTQFHFGAFEAGEVVAHDLTDSQRAMQPFQLVRVPDFAAVPMPGEPVVPPRPPVASMAGPASRFRPWATVDIAWIEPPPSLAETLRNTAADIATSLIPVYGDVLDILELGGALITGRDRWGQRVAFTDLVMMGLGAVMPFVNRRELQLTAFVAMGGLGASVVLPAYMESEDEVLFRP